MSFVVVSTRDRGGDATKRKEGRKGKCILRE